MNLSELARIAFQTQLERMQLNLEGCLEGLDPIHLHDLRVANRRMRAALIDFQALLPDPVFNQYQEDFRWIHQVTGPVRDLDVGLSYFPVYEKELSKSWREELIPARELLEKKRQTAQQELAVNLGSSRVEDILNSFSALLGDRVLEGSQYALEPAREFGCRCIIKRYKKVRKNGLEIGKNTPANHFHELRIRVKKLRYMMEFFHPVFDPEEVTKVRSGLKNVQDALGAYQDAEIQVAKLVQLAGDLQGSGSSVDSILALGQLIGIYEKEIRRSRKRSLKTVHWLTGDPAAREFQSCFQYPVD